MSIEYETAVQRIRLATSNRPCVVIIGSTSFWDPESEATCQQIGQCLSELPDLVLVTGGMSGVADVMGRSFYAATRAASGDARVIHVLPVDCQPRPYGVTMFAGEDMFERREVLGRLANLYITLEGGPGTEHEASVAQSCGATIVPVGRSGGVAAELYSSLACPPEIDPVVWSVLNEVPVHPKAVAEAVKTVISCLLR